MPKDVEFYFDFMSPYSYLANVALHRLAAERGAVIHYQPLNLPALMKLVGNRPTTLECKNKGAYVMRDVHRWAQRYHVTLLPNPDWEKVDFAELARGALVALEDGRGTAYVNAIFTAHWEKAADLAQRSVLSRVLDEAGFNAERVLARAGARKRFADLEQATRSAAEKGVFGSPTMFVGEEMFFGNDRLDFMTTLIS